MHALKTEATRLKTAGAKGVDLFVQQGAVRVEAHGERDDQSHCYCVMARGHCIVMNVQFRVIRVARVFVNCSSHQGSAPA
jgi:hypothetical protein